MSRSFRAWLTAGLLCIASTALAQPVVMRISHQVPPAHHLSKLLQDFAADVKVRTKGSVDVQLFGSEQLAKAGRLVGSKDQLLENSHPSSAPAALSQRGTNEGLHVQVERRRLVHCAGLVDVVASTVRAGVTAVAPFRVEVSDAGHRELIGRLERDLDLAAASAPQVQRRAFRVSSAALELHPR